MPRREEYELRFTFRPEDTERVISHSLLGSGLRDRQTSRLISTYFDTPDGILQRNRFGLRVRRSDHAITHTLKQTNGSLLARGEWERSHDDPEPDVGWLRQTPLEPLLREERVASSIGQKFSVDVTRTTLPLNHRKTSIEVAIDQGTISAAGVALTLSEIELEVKRGRKAAVLDLACRLARDLPLVLTLASKAERGYGLGDRTWGRPVKAIVPAMHKHMTLAQAFESIVQTCLHVFLKNVALIDLEGDGEALHRARIAMRHLRAGCQLFKPALRRKRFAALRPEIKWLSDKLGAARDADVFQESFYDPAARDGTVAGAQTLAVVMSEHRRRAHAKLHEALASRRARLLFIELLALSTDGVRRRARFDRCRSYVRTALDRRRRGLVRQAEGLASMPITKMHEVRKSAKMLRYDLDLFAGVPKVGSGKRVRRLGKNLKVLQQSLGVLNDEHAMRRHLRETVLTARFSERSPSGEARRAVLAAAQICARQASSDARLREAEAAVRQL